MSTIKFDIAALIANPDDYTSDERKQAAEAVADLIAQMRDVLALWDSNTWHIDAKSACVQCRPDKWLAALAKVSA